MITTVVNLLFVLLSGGSVSADSNKVKPEEWSPVLEKMNCIRDLEFKLKKSDETRDLIPAKKNLVYGDTVVRTKGGLEKRENSGLYIDGVQQQVEISIARDYNSVNGRQTYTDTMSWLRADGSTATVAIAEKEADTERESGRTGAKRKVTVTISPREKNKNLSQRELMAEADKILFDRQLAFYKNLNIDFTGLTADQILAKEKAMSSTLFASNVDKDGRKLNTIERYPCLRDLWRNKETGPVLLETANRFCDSKKASPAIAKLDAKQQSCKIDIPAKDNVDRWDFEPFRGGSTNPPSGTLPSANGVN